MRESGRLGIGCCALLLWVLGSLVSIAHAIDFDIPVSSDDPIKGVLNTTFTIGGGIRTQSPSVHLIGKANLNPNVCAPPYQSCQGLFKDQYYPAQHLAEAPGAASMNGDDGDLDYRKGDLIQAPAKVTQDLQLTYHNFGVFARGLYFYDFVNNDFTEYHPDRITPQNYLTVGRCSPATDLRFYGQKGPNCNGTSSIVYGPGGVVRNKRTDGEVLSEAGTNLQYLDSYIYGKLPIPFTDGKEFTFKLGRQLVNWGESTLLVLNSINIANPINANNFTRIGSQVEEVFTPINMAFMSFEPFENASLEGYYQLEWKTTEASAPGTYFSSLDLGTSNAGRSTNVNASFGGSAEDPNGVGSPIDNPLAGITPTSLTIPRLPDREPRTGGQFGVKLGYYAEWLNSGTDLSFYFENYHSRVPYASFYAANTSCARKGGNTVGGAQGTDATDIASFILDCPDIPLLHTVSGVGAPANTATSDAVGFDTARLQLEYPEDIQLYGFSFNTSYGDYSFQGEVAYRPNLPLQIATTDLAFAAFGPSLTSCHHQNCLGSTAGLGTDANGNMITYGNSNANPNAALGAGDTFDLGVGHIDGSARSFPNFVIPYRGGVVGDNPGCPKGLSDSQYNPGLACYIRGYEREQVYEFDLGATRVLGNTDNPIGADQVLLLAEIGATYVPFLPGLDQLQFQASGINYGASAGADGSGANGSRQACSTNPTCVIGPDGLRFNPHQQDLTGYPDKLSYGYRFIAITRYESVLPGISIQNQSIYSQDVAGTSPIVGDQFIAGRKSFSTLFETRYKSAFSFSLGYSWFWGGGVYNPLSDRDFAQFFVKYQF
jgi:hypothetical protein